MQLTDVAEFIGQPRVAHGLQKLVGLPGTEAAQVAAVAEQHLHAGALAWATLVNLIYQAHGLLAGVQHGFADG